MTIRSFTTALTLGLATISATGPAFAQSSQGASQADAQFELAFWQAVATSADKAQYEAYLAKYPNGTFSSLAALKIVALSRGASAPSGSASSYSSSTESSAGSGIGSSSSLSSYGSSSAGGGSSIGGSSMGGSSMSSGSSSAGGSSMGGGSSTPSYGSSSVGGGSSVGLGSSNAGYGGSSSGSSSIGGSSSAGYGGSSMGSGSSSSGYSGSQVGGSSMEGSSSSNSAQVSNAGQPASTKKQLLGAALSIGAALMANSKQKKAANQGISSSSAGSSSGGSSSGGSSFNGSNFSGSSSGGSGSGSSSGSSQQKSGTQAILGKLLPVASGLTGGKLGSGDVSGSGGQQGGTTSMLINTALQLVMPSRPSLTAVSTPNLPASFCSADARNRFYETAFKPALALADKNNNDSIAYMQVLQQLFDAAGQKKDSGKMSAFSSEAQSFASTASQAQSTRLNFGALFSQLMARPLGKC